MTRNYFDDRAVSASVSHILAIAISALVISGLLIAANGVYTDERDQRAREQLFRTIGHRLADEITRASELAQDGGSISLRTYHQSRVGGSTYTVDLLTGSDCNAPLFTTESCLQLAMVTDGVSVKVPLQNATPVTLRTATGGSFTIAANPSGGGPDRTDPPVNIEKTVGMGDLETLFQSGASVNITNRKPISGFTFTPGQPTVDSVIHFENDTADLDGVIEQHNWTLGDGTTKTGVKEFTHSYAEPGKYNVTLTVTDDDGETDSVSKVVVVAGLVYDENAVAGDIGGVSHGRVNFTVTNKHPSSGSGSGEVRITEIYLDPADDSIDGLGEAISGVEEFEIDGDADDHTDNQPAVIHDGGLIHELSLAGNQDVTRIDANQSAHIEFNGFDEEDANDNEMEDAPKVDMEGKKVFVSIHYEVDGEFYSTQFTLFGPSGGNSPPDPEFTAGCADFDCSFDATNSSDPDPGGSIASYEWEFGDGTTATGSTPSHTFSQSGEYDVSLTVTDENGTTSTLTKTVQVGAPSQWYSIDWGNRKSITIDHTQVAGDLTNFPVLIQLTDTDLAAQAQNDGDDILFTKGDGTSQLNHEIESFDGATGELTVWVNVTELSGSSDTTLYLYYDNPTASNQENVTDVWGPDFEMVQHFEENTGVPTDSTANNNDGTNNGAGQGAAGNLDGAYDFDAGGSEDVTVPDSINDGPFSISIWFESPGNGWDGILFDATEDDKYFHVYVDDHDVDWCLEDEDDDDMHIDSGDPDLGDGDWHYTVVTAEYGGSGPHVLFLDGANVGTDSTSLGDKPSLEPPEIGHYTDSYDGNCESKDDFEGTIDEVRIVSRQLSAQWVETEYNNQYDTTTFYSVGQEEFYFNEAGGEVVMEAENYSRTVAGNDADIGPSDGDNMADQGWSIASEPGASGIALEATPNQGDSALDTENGERLDYYVNFSSSGTYRIWVRMKCPSASDDAIHVGLNGTPVSYGGDGVNRNGSNLCHGASGWMWASHVGGSQMTLQVPAAGKHTVNVWMVDDGTFIDKIVLRKLDNPPTGSGPGESTKS